MRITSTRLQISSLPKTITKNPKSFLSTSNTRKNSRHNKRDSKNIKKIVMRVKSNQLEKQLISLKISFSKLDKSTENLELVPKV